MIGRNVASPTRVKRLPPPFGPVVVKFGIPEDDDEKLTQLTELHGNPISVATGFDPAFSEVTTSASREYPALRFRMKLGENTCTYDRANPCARIFDVPAKLFEPVSPDGKRVTFGSVRFGCAAFTAAGMIVLGLTAGNASGVSVVTS